MNYAVQGSQDAQTWKTLKTHSNDQTLKMAGQYASWAVTGYAACISFRFFRLFKNSCSGSAVPRQLSLAYLELYGYLSVSPEDRKPSGEQHNGVLLMSRPCDGIGNQQRLAADFVGFERAAV